MRLLPVILVSVVASAGALAQQAAFDVVSVKRSSDPMRRVLRPVMGEVRPGGVWIATDVLLINLVRYAYPGHPLAAHIVGAAEWTERDFFDVEARGNPDATRFPVPTGD